MMQNINDLLRNLNQNQLKEINDFLNTAQGRKLKNKINSSDKQELLRELGKLSPDVVNSKLKNISKQDLMKIINNL